mgnify:CR=1 FL=1
MIKYSCANCGRVFEGNNDWDTGWAKDQHQKYCQLPTRHKILRVLSFPLAAIALFIILPGAILFYILAPLSYPFVYAVDILDFKYTTWDEFIKKIYGDQVHSYKPKGLKYD